MYSTWVLTAVEDGGSTGVRGQRGLRGRAGGGGGGGGAGRAPARPQRGPRRVPDHVDLLLIVIWTGGPWRPRVGLPFLGHKTARHVHEGGRAMVGEGARGRGMRDRGTASRHTQHTKPARRIRKN